jgi:hypothetical protein
VDRRAVSLVLLLLFVVCTGAAIVVDGSRPASASGLAPAVIQGAGYLLGLVAAVLLLVGMATARLAVRTGVARRAR